MTDHIHAWGNPPLTVITNPLPPKRWCSGCGLLQAHNARGHNGSEWVDMGHVGAPEPAEAVVATMTLTEADAPEAEGDGSLPFPREKGGGWWELSDGQKVRANREGAEAAQREVVGG